jgi:hypothetical protein
VCGGAGTSRCRCRGLFNDANEVLDRSPLFNDANAD